MNIYKLSYKAKHQGSQNEFTIGVQAHGLDEKNAMQDGLEHLKRHYKNIQYAILENVEYVETVKERIEKINNYQRD